MKQNDKSAKEVQAWTVEAVLPNMNALFLRIQ